LAERYRQTKRFLILKKEKAHDSTTALERIDPDPEGTEFLLLSPDWSRREIFLGDLSGSAVKPAVIGIYTFWQQLSKTDFKTDFRKHSLAFTIQIR
jgi:hypothetical protein